MSTSPYDIILHPLFTEKSTMMGQFDKYAFVVRLDSNKTEIKRAIEKVFDVKVKSINTQIVRGKVKRFGRTSGKRPNWKKAIVTLREGSTDMFDV